jgi:hypothetical protein
VSDMDKKENRKMEDCKICYGCGGCEDYENRKALNDLYSAYEYGQAEEKFSGNKIPGTGEKNGNKE